MKLDQAKLNIISRSRTSRLPWRGQFSPELVEYLLDILCPDADVVFDPFCGSGTVLFEAAQCGKNGIGAEVNPAAWHLASLVSFCSLSTERQSQVKHEMRKLRESMVGEGDLFSCLSTQADMSTLLEMPASDSMLRACLSAAILLGMGDKMDRTREAAIRGLAAVEALLTELVGYPGTGACHLCDARATLLDTGSVDAVVTSPPYINVFNYHQNYRPAAEMLGWQPLEAAQSEIGANRKHRGNRFLTVVQYCLDMAEALNEIARVCKLGAPVILVVGRESNVLGAAFRNGDLLKRLMQHNSGSFELRACAERVFINRFGQRIYEDVIVSRCIGQAAIALDHARQVGTEALNAAIGLVPDENRPTLIAARSLVERVLPSRLLSISQPGFAA